jgi:PAS domain S-box-containing protein
MPKRILIADDSALVAAMLSNALKGAGYETVMASDGIQAIQKAYSESPDLICLDIYMPRMNGYQACRLLKNDPQVADIPIIILTASEDKSAAEFWSKQTGSDSFLPKSNDRQILIDTVAGLLSTRPDRVENKMPAPDPEEILSRVSDLVDRELYQTTIQSIQSETILANLADGILTLDTDNKIVSVNPAACALIGKPASELIGHTVAEALGGAATVTEAMLTEALSGTKPEAQDSQLDTGVPVSIQAVALNDHLGKTVGGIWVGSDITRRKEIEALNSQLKELDKAKQDLTHMIVHDLRTPMTSLITGLQTVPLLGDMNEDQTEFLGIALNGAQTLLGMINDLLDISKMEDGSMSLDKSDFETKKVVEEAFRQVNSIATDKAILLSMEIADNAVKIHADEEKLRRILINLLGNALKFTPAKQSVKVLVSLQPNTATPTFLFAVQDTGEGIPKEAFSKIFEKFGQVEGRKEGRKNSTGLGLTFCKMATEAHGGEIWVDSELGVGSTFSFTIPQ